MTLDRRQFLAGSAALSGVNRAQAAERTNVVMIMTDDHGAWSLGCYGNPEGHTPNLDRLAAGGVRFNRTFAAAAVCSPSRMSYMTGKMPCQHGVQDYILGEEREGPEAKRFLDPHTTYSEILAEQGYELGYFGKWHMGDTATPQKGFRHWFATGGGSYRTTKYYLGDRTGEAKQYRTDWITDRALEFIEASRNKTFFAQVSYNAPHTPYDYQPEQYREPYLESKLSAFPTEEPHPNQIPVYRKYLGQRESRVSYMALVKGVDHNVGRIVAKLEQLGLGERTLVVFCADQGFNCGHHGVWGKGNGTLPFNMYEQTVRIPFIFHHPGTIQGKQVLEPMVSTLDFFPTLLDYLGLPPHNDPEMVGRSFAGFLRGSSPTRENRIFVEYAYARMIRTERFKYVQKGDGHPDEMYDLDADPGERRNLAADPDSVRQRSRLRDELATWFAARGAPPIERWRLSVRNKLAEGHYRR